VMIWEPIARQLGFTMDQPATTPSDVLAFAPKQMQAEENSSIDQAGHATVAMLREAASISHENVDRAMSMAHKLAIQLRDAEERIVHLQGQVERLETRAACAERWLETIKREIEDKLIAPMEARRPDLPVLH
jgi:predicted PhzF superfamily epimerase YddE/YHI9